MSWHGHLHLHYRTDADSRTIALDRHEGPLRVLQRLYPEGPGICHHVLVHPPGGIVGGDELDIHLQLDAGTHALLTTPGATRFYRSAGPLARQSLRARLDAGARLEWLPLETIAYRGCRAENRLHFELAPGAEMIGWDVLALGLPAAAQAFDHGRYLQQLELPGAWLERGLIDGSDALLLDSPLGLDRRRVLASLWFATGTPIERALGEALIDAARAAIDGGPLSADAGVTRLHERVVVLRALADRVEPAMQLLQAVWSAWRPLAFGLAPCAPRVWRT
ncbi:urease accessory protein UreD [Aquincola sp. S2]|uniref:Urease accessory protein UreD n=1 Tax=Pseudaquabacterium terrae TaxID=2732868 RepID=A0ABX2EK84_9BURK|nr:urease accessory protein UreD [Aquabacterium terrae]NRF69013.1 urease accessory protein UreD [Aquabacterium terrae]